MVSKRGKKTVDKKQIIEIVGKYKIPILIAALTLFVGIAFICLFYNLARQGKEQQSFSMEEQEQLIDMAAYLHEIDDVVTMNREQLAEVMFFQSDTVYVLDGFKESLSEFENSLTQIITSIQSYAETEASINHEMLVSLTDLSKKQQEIKEQITTANESIVAMISEIKSKNEDNFTTAFGKMEKLQNDLEKTQQDVKDYYNSLTELILLLQEDSNSQHDELVNILLAAQDDLAELLEKGFEVLRIQMDEDFTALMEKLNRLHGQIVDATDSIMGLLMLMEENDASRQEEIKAAFASVSASLELIRTDYANAHTNLQSLIQNVQKTQNTNHEETLSVLTVMESNMEEVSLENLNHITNSLQMMEENFSVSINNMQGEMQQSFSTLNTEIVNGFSQVNDSITNQFKELNENVSNQYQNISSTIINNNDNQQESLDNLMDYLNQKLQEVFQFVSNGKKKLASALLTKGVSIQEDATFAEIYQAILDTPQELVIGVQQIPGIISYDYHYHTDSQGMNPHEEVVSSAGGCYTTPVYHVHTGSSGSGGGCYTSPIYHNHGGSCYSEGNHNSSCPSYIERHSYDCGSVHDYDGDGHGCDGFIAYECGGHRYLSCKLGSGIIGYSLGCGKNNSTVEGYRPACRLADGQIIGAHIIYDGEAFSIAAMMNVEETYESYVDILEENIEMCEDGQTVSGNDLEAEEEETEAIHELEVLEDSVIIETEKEALITEELKNVNMEEE